MLVQHVTRTTSRALRRPIASELRVLSTSTFRNDEKPTSFSQPQVYLNPERKRKLVLLYHQAEHFITDENLSKKIDEEFERVASESTAFTLNRREDSRFDLMKDLGERRARGKLIVETFTSKDDFRSRDSYDPTEKKAQWRERQVQAALFGLDESAKPGLEMADEKAHEMGRSQGNKS